MLFKNMGKDKPNIKKHNNSKRVTFFKKLYLNFKKWQEIEDEKRQLKEERKNNYSIRPKGYIQRKIGVFSFWVLFGFMFLVVMVTIFSKNTEKSAADEVIQIEINQATSPEAIEFAKSFLNDYFTWTATNDFREKRKELMVKYVAEKMRGHKAFEIPNMDWNSRFINAELKQIEEKGSNLAYLTFLVTYEYEETNHEEDKKPKIKTIQKYIAVPIAYDGYSFGIYELPKITFVFEEETTVKDVKFKRLEHADTQIINKIRDFLPTFFKTYAEDGKAQLNFMITKESVTDGLNGSMLFDGIENSNVFIGEKDNEFIVFAEIRLIDPLTDTVFYINHQLELVQQDDKFLVSGMDNFESEGVLSKVGIVETTENSEDTNTESETEDKDNDENK